MRSAPPIPSASRRKRGPTPAPKHFQLTERRMWAAIVKENQFEGEAAFALLRATLESHQRARLCREAIESEGATYQDRFDQPKPHPLLASERDARSAFMAGMRALNLDLIGEAK